MSSELSPSKDASGTAGGKKEDVVAAMIGHAALGCDDGKGKPAKASPTEKWQPVSPHRTSYQNEAKAGDSPMPSPCEPWVRLSMIFGPKATFWTAVKEEEPSLSA